MLRKTIIIGLGGVLVLIAVLIANTEVASKEDNSEVLKMVATAVKTVEHPEIAMEEQEETVEVEEVVEETIEEPEEEYYEEDIYEEEYYEEPEEYYVELEDGTDLEDYTSDEVYVIESDIGMDYVGTFEITAYEWTGNPCANGNYPTEGYTIACNSLPLGTRVYIEGIGYRTVEDRGASWHGDSWLDLYLGSVDACYEFGRQYLDVYVVN